jgi:dTDP-4-amino-4,6-dideoxygalactose transaminase
MDELLATVERIARTAGFVGGPEVDAFEEEFAAYCGTRFALGVSSGTEALVLALRALNVGPGDECIVPANSFIATAEAVSLVGASPRFVDVHPDTALVTAELIEPAINERTKVIMPVHLYGRTVDLDPIMEIARARQLFVIEDACQAHGAWMSGRRAGSVGDAAAFSFYPAKNLGAWGDAGGLVTNNQQIDDFARLYRSHGERPRYNHRIPGTTARMDAIHAAILRIKLRRLEEVNDGRRRVAAALTAALEGAGIGLPAPVGEGSDHVWHQFVVTCDHRDGLRAHLADHGIAAAIHYPVAIHKSEAYASLETNDRQLPVAERLAETILSLPMYPGMTSDDIDRIASAVKSF